MSMGADAVIDVQKEDALARVLELTDGRGVDVIVDCTSGAGTAPVLLGIEAAKRRGATMLRALTAVGDDGKLRRMAAVVLKYPILRRCV